MIQCWKYTLSIICRREGLHKRSLEEYHGVTEKAYVLFLTSCGVSSAEGKIICESLVVKPISSTRFLSRCQVDLIHFRDMSETQHCIPINRCCCSRTILQNISSSTSQTRVSCVNCKCIGRDFLWPRSSSLPSVRKGRRIQQQHVKHPTKPEMAFC